MVFYATYPTGGSGTFVSSLNGETGAVTLVAGSNITITPSGSNITIASTGGGTQVYTNMFTLTPTDIANKFVTLSNTALFPTDAQLTVIGGILQIYGFDFTISGMTLSWAATDLDGFLASGDELFVFYY